MDAPTFELIRRWLWLANTVLCVVLLVRMAALKLSSAYKFFLASLVFSIIRFALLWWLPVNSDRFINFWKWTEPITWLFSTLVVLELCTLIFKEYRGIQVLGRRTIYASTVVAMLVSLILILPTWRQSDQPMMAIPRFLLVERGVYSALVILLFLFLVFLPIPLSRNVVLHSVLYAAFFLAGSLGIFIAGKTSQQTGIIVNTCLMGVAFLCLVAWIALLSRAGETKIATIPKPLPSSYEEKLVEQLASINATLLRASSKVDSGLVSK